MSKKIPLGISLTCIFLAVAITAAVTLGVYNKRYDSLIQDLPQRIRQYSKLSEIDELVRSEYYGAIDSDKLEADIAAGYVDGLNDPYSFYLDAAGYKAYNDFMKGHIAGTGISVRFDADNTCMAVTDIAPDSSGDTAGIAAGALIYSVDGEVVTSKNFRTLSDKLADGTGSSIKLGLMKVDADGNITRSSVSVKDGYDAVSCEYAKIGDIGYIRLSSFYDNTYDVFAAALDEFLNNGVSGLIIDVRDNSSTNIEAAVKIIDRIVPMANEGTGAVATARNSKGQDISIYSSDSASISLPAVVLINANTNGAAELLACDLRDFGKARLIGDTTAGNGSMQKLFELDDGGAVVLSVAKIYPYKSDCYDGKGVTPDDKIEAENSVVREISVPPAADDIQYQAAYAFLTNKQ